MKDNPNPTIAGILAIGSISPENNTVFYEPFQQFSGLAAVRTFKSDHLKTRSNFSAEKK